MVAAYATWVHILEQNKGKNVYNILTAVIFLLTLEMKHILWMHTMELIKFHTYYAAIYIFKNISLSVVHFCKEDIPLYRSNLKQYFIHKN